MDLATSFTVSTVSYLFLHSRERGTTSLRKVASRDSRFAISSIRTDVCNFTNKDFPFLFTRVVTVYDLALSITALYLPHADLQENVSYLEIINWLIVTFLMPRGKVVSVS